MLLIPILLLLEWATSMQVGKVQELVPHQFKRYMDSYNLVQTNSSIKQNPIGSYAPYSVLCPATSLIRTADNQPCQQERTYISNRNVLTEVALAKLFERNKIPGFNYTDFHKSKPTKIALAISGGGYRAMLLGAGVLNAFDDRSGELNSLSGLLQATSYIGGISGGSWLVMSNFINDFKPVEVIREKYWSLDIPLLMGVPSFDQLEVRDKIESEPQAEDGGFFSNLRRFFGMAKASVPKESFFSSLTSLFSNSTDKVSITDIFSYYKELHIEVRPKKVAGFYLSFTDYWGRALARRLFSNISKSPGVTMTSSIELESFKTYLQPFPIVATIEKRPDYKDTSKDSHLFEFTPYEFGLWDSYLNAFVPVKYLGSSLYDGISTNLTKYHNISYCVSGFDNVGYLTATLSSLFNHIFVHIYKLVSTVKLDVSEAIYTVLKTFGLSLEYDSTDIPQLHPDYALFSPNPFFGMKGENKSTRDISFNRHMYLVDGGDDGQNIPIQPFLISGRNLDAILAFDFTADLDNYPNGTTIFNMANRYHNRNSSFTLPHFTIFGQNNIKSSFPKVPSRVEFLKNSYNNRPMFLGCNLSDYPDIKISNAISLTDTFATNTTVAAKLKIEENLPPLIIYIPNSNQNPEGFQANTSTFKFTYLENEVDEMLTNGYNLATSSNSTLFAVCLNCAILKREFDKAHLTIESFEVPSICNKCYRSYCY